MSIRNYKKEIQIDNLNDIEKQIDKTISRLMIIKADIKDAITDIEKIIKESKEK